MPRIISIDFVRPLAPTTWPMTTWPNWHLRGTTRYRDYGTSLCGADITDESTEHAMMIPAGSIACVVCLNTLVRALSLMDVGDDS